MRQAGGGKIIMIGSMMSIFGASFTGPYAATKGGIVQLAKALGCAWARTISRSTRYCRGGSIRR